MDNLVQRAFDALLAHEERIEGSNDRRDIWFAEDLREALFDLLDRRINVHEITIDSDHARSKEVGHYGKRCVYGFVEIDGLSIGASWKSIFEWRDCWKELDDAHHFHLYWKSPVLFVKRHYSGRTWYGFKVIKSKWIEFSNLHELGKALAS